MVRNCVFWFHWGLGILAGVVILAMAVTGMGIAFKPQLIALSNKSVWILPAPAQSQRVLISELLEKVDTQHPDKMIQSLTVYSDPTRSVKLMYGKKKEALYLDPYAGTELGQESTWSKRLNQLEALHRWFGMEGASRLTVQQVKAFATLILILMVLSGLYLSWPFRLGMLTGFKNPLQWHRSLGVWLSPFILVIAVTGLVMASGAEAPGKRGAKAKIKLQAYPLETVISAVSRVHPRWVSMSLRPEKPELVSVILEEPGPYKLNRLKLSVDISGEIKQEKALNTWTKGLHTGEVGGFLGACLAFITSLVTVVLVITGFWMAYLRLRRKK